MINTKRGIIRISKDIFEKVQEKMNSLNCIIYNVEYEPFYDTYKVLFTSEYIDQIDIGTSVPYYVLDIDSGIRLRRI